jgi:prolyl-tRNA synthetase family I
MLSSEKVDTKKETDFPDWYTQVLTKSEMLEYYDISGCYILRPNSYFIWEQIQHYLDKKFKENDVKNCYFPIFVSKDSLETEKTHIADFAPEVAWVTKSGSHQLDKEIAIRPTSETIMYPYVSKWLQSHRDLPIKLNQWCNVVRWEFKHPTPFIRSREFLWQEGHTSHATVDEAIAQVETCLKYYYDTYHELLSVPVIMGRKTEGEKFAGSNYSTTVEAFIPENGKGIQGATSHYLAQNFSKMFNVTYTDDKAQLQHVYQTSWGFTTRSIGVMIMTHSDNKGLVLPPKVAYCQVVIIPTGITVTTAPELKQKIYDKCQEIHKFLRLHAIRSQVDLRDDKTPGWKYNYWELRGVPLRIDIGPREITGPSITTVNRINGEKTPINYYDGEHFANTVSSILDKIQVQLLSNAYAKLEQATVPATQWDEFLDGLREKKLIAAPFCNKIQCETNLKDLFKSSDDYMQGTKTLCIPINQTLIDLSNGMKCINPNCQHICKYYTLFGKSY